ncbi:Serine hydroxymethyltransferase [Candidatus Cyrtobacter comes]|uniref:Serine hydroxymethyltransferase n=1 Tax=Candidatus Cyrtobacter comes TaxID=675776 RepID=A0ABU5LA98_9RICK|nr:serine hydroxymethyltransferase [Candidatus Cyrtobacter comes]MDZ5762774.1 Serine hydroxymethyltransferase [Candidatus Cyrtobacter comes]
MNFFSGKLLDADPEIGSLISKELERQNYTLELIASENIASSQVLEAAGSCLTNKYAEGYPGKRYYGGCEYVDKIEEIAIDRLKSLYGCRFANVQPHSGSQANQAAFLALLKPGDKVLSLSLDCGGHLTHGSPVNMSGKWFDIKHYAVNRDTYLIDYDEVRSIAEDFRPRLIIAGCSSYPRALDFAKFRDIADSVGAYLMVDMAHIAGLVAAGLHQNPVEHSHVVTSTTHKTLRGPRGGIIICNDEAISKKIDSAVFPGIQGGPLMHIIAAKAVAFGLALQDDFREYMKMVVSNSKKLADVLINNGFHVITGGTDTHMLVIDLQNKGITGREAEERLDKARLTCNKNSIPFDKKSFITTSGIRLGSPACTTRGLGNQEFELIGNYISSILSTEYRVDSLLTDVSHKVLELCKKFPI